MKKLLIILVVGVFIIVGCTSSKKESSIDKMVNDMTLEEKIGQMMIIFYRKDKMDDTLRNSLNTVKPGGFILFDENFSTYEDSLKLIKEIKASSKIPMFISIDQEGGKIQRLKSVSDTTVSDVPRMYYVGGMNDAKLSEDVGKVVGEELRVFGINMDFAPVLDIYENKDNTVIGKRSFGDDKDTVSEQALAFSKGLSSTGVIPVYKHFPGHGNTSVDSHYDLPVVTKTKEELLNDDIVPFKKAIESGAEVIMIGHLAVPDITGDNTPASLSKKIISDLLKDELGFKGLVITDALNMGALTKNYSQEDIYVRAINAGVDILLMPSGSVNALNSIKKAVEEGKISEDTINKSVRKILELKYKTIEKDYNNYLDKSYLNNDKHKEIINKVNVNLSE